MKNRYLRYSILIIIALLAIGFMIARTNQMIAHLPKQSKPPSYPFDEARKIAEANLPKFMSSVGPNYESYGFKSLDEIQRATLGTPYIGYAFDLLDIPDSAQIKGDIRDSLYGGVEITFPVLVEGKPRARMAVEYRDGVWQDGAWSGGGPNLIVDLQKRLATKGISERLDVLYFGFGSSMFGMIDINGQTMLIPLQDNGKNFPELDFGSDRMYTLDEVLPLVRVQAQRSVEAIDRQNQEIQKNMPTQGPTFIPEPTTTPVPVYPAPIMQPSATPDVLHPTFTPIPAEAPEPAYPAP